jgi:hypothetical protein
MRLTIIGLSGFGFVRRFASLRNEVVAAAVLLAGCGSGLSYVVDGEALGDIAASEKAPIFDAMGAVNRTQDDVYRTRYLLALAQKEVDVAAPEYEMAKLELDRAKTEREFAASAKEIGRAHV